MDKFSSSDVSSLHVLNDIYIYKGKVCNLVFLVMFSKCINLGKKPSVSEVFDLNIQFKGLLDAC